MLVLVVDTSSAAVTAGLVSVSATGVDTEAERVEVNARAHGELLAPAIAGVLADSGHRRTDLAAVVAGTGPGPFTGLRVGLVTAAALGDALAIPTYGVCSLDAIAVGVDVDGDLLVAGDARRKEVYWARYLGRDRVAGPDVSRPSDLTDVPRQRAGAGIRLYADVLGPPTSGVDTPTVAGLAACAADRVRAHAPGEVLVPLYLRRPDAQVPAAPKQVGR